jgi:hypothetical protein
MPTDLLFPEDIDARLSWPPGRAARLARRGRLPHYILPDGSIRLRWGEIAPLIRHHATEQPSDETGVPRAV